MKKADQILILSAFLLTFMLTKTINVMQDTKEIPFDTNRYVVSEDATVFDSTKDRFVHHYNHEGYRRIRLHGKTFYLHKVVALIHLPNPNGYLEINHKDGNKSNNHVSNLEWCSRGYNVRHAWRTGLSNGNNGICLKQKVSEIISLYSSGNYSMRDIAKMYNVSDPTICRLINKKTDKYNVT